MSTHEHPDAVLSRLATIRNGLVTRHDALDAGVTRHELYRRVNNGQLHRVFRGVYRVGIAALDRAAFRQAALLRLGDDAATVAHGAAEVHGLLEPLEQWLQVAVPGGRRRLRLTPEVPMHDGTRPVVLVRQAPRLAVDTVRLEGEATTSVARTLIDIAGSSTRSFHRAWREAGYRGLLDVAAIEATLGAWRWPGRATVAAQLAAHRAITTTNVRYDSPAEFDAIQLVLRAGIPSPQVNHWIHTRRRRRRADLYWEYARVVVEIDGWAGHSTPEAFADDRERDREFLELGILTLRFTVAQLETHPERCAQQIIEQLEARSRAVAPANDSRALWRHDAAQTHSAPRVQ